MFKQMIRARWRVDQNQPALVHCSVQNLVFAGRKVVIKQATGDDFQDMLATLGGLIGFPAPA